MVTTITIHQLEQAILFERATRFAELMRGNASAAKHYKADTAAFITLTHQVDAEIISAEEMIASLIEHETKNGDSPKVIAEFQHVFSILKKIEKEHKEFDHQAESIFKLFEQGRVQDARALAEKTEVIEEKLNHELVALQHELDQFTVESAKDAEHLEKMLLNILFLTSLISTAIFLVVATLIVRGIIKPLLATRHYAEELSNGNLDIDQPIHKSQDEIADMMAALTVFKANAIEANNLRHQQKEQEIAAEHDKRQAMQELANSFDLQVGGAIGSLASAATELQSTAESMKRVADDTSSSSATVAASSEESSVNVNTVASAMEEMSATAAEIALQVTLAKTRSNDTARDAQTANDTVGNLNQLVENIGEVVEAIQDIAEQTNLLALNATIEAARAGEAGKGFAVVADEVKKLATETAKKTDEINVRITEIKGATTDSVTAMGRIIQNISEIDQSVTGVSAAVEEQNATTEEITRSISEASQGAQDVSQIIIDVQKGAEETGSSADTVLVAANEVSQLSENLKASVDSFLETIRTDNKD